MSMKTVYFERLFSLPASGLFFWIVFIVATIDKAPKKVGGTASGMWFLKKNQNAPRPSEHPPVRGEKMPKRLVRWDQRLQIQNLFMAFKRVPLWW